MPGVVSVMHADFLCTDVPRPIHALCEATFAKRWDLAANQQVKRHNMGKKRIITTQESKTEQPKHSTSKSKRQVLKGTINIASSYNNTIVSVADAKGEVFTWTTAGSMGFRGARKSTPYAATIVAKEATERAKRFGLQEARVIVRGIGPGREAAIRGIASTGIIISSIVDDTPQAHNGVRPPKPRRV